MKITVELLKEMKACREGIKYFQDYCPNGADLSLLWGSDQDASWAWGIILANFMPWVSWAWNQGLLPAIRPSLRANLQYADLQSADLQSADLRYANLQYADLQSADLQYADLRYADLQYADLQYADLQYADLQYADLQSADYNQFTRFPEGFDPEKHGMVKR